ncbi:MAG: helix-turn-helix transcriptional regulator [Candidatus Gracilibacteria bacterium]|nr:helix-turn-helix transcriptional regulator [Candidatus Gracilibacteria bacterium]
MKPSAAENWIGERVRELRKDKGISQEVLAVKAGIPMVSLAKVEQGQIKKPSFPMVWKITIALGISLNEFVEGLNSQELLFNANKS